ncbi:MAG: pyridoxal phosphate-dependent aminotransferase [archaeon]
MGEFLPSDRMARIRPSRIRELFDLAQGVEGIISFGIGEPDFNTPEHIKEACKKSLDSNQTHYSPTAGIFELRKALAEKYQTQYNTTYDPKSEILITVGGCQALFVIPLCFLNKGDELIIPDPGFLTYEAQAHIADAKPVFLSMKETDGFKVDIDALENTITEKTRMLILNFPSNPTGAMMSKKEFEQVAEIVEGKDIIVVSDECYEPIVYDGYKPVHFGEILREQTIAINSFSKTYAMAGWRVGFVTAPAGMMKQLYKIQQYSAAAVSTPMQEACVAALKGPQDATRKMVEAYDKRRKFLVRALNDVDGITCPNPGGAFYVFPNIKETGKTSDEVAKHLLTDAKVVTVPGNSFGAHGEGYLRLTYATSMAQIKEGAERIKESIAKL